MGKNPEGQGATPQDAGLPASRAGTQTPPSGSLTARAPAGLFLAGRSEPGRDPAGPQTTCDQCAQAPAS